MRLRERKREKQTKVHDSKGKFSHFKGKQKGSKIREAMPTKIGLHAFAINLYLHEIYEPILFFDPPPPHVNRCTCSIHTYM